MTVEEKAKEYVKENLCKKCHKHCKEGMCTCTECKKKTYLDGYEQGYEDCRHYAHDYYKQKWHDLRKDPNDLPEEQREYWTKWEDGTYCTAHYFADNGFGSYVIAWCELPKFEE